MHNESLILLLMLCTFAGGYLCGRQQESVARRSRLANDAALVARERGRKDKRRRWLDLRVAAQESGDIESLEAMQSELERSRDEWLGKPNGERGVE